MQQLILKLSPKATAKYLEIVTAQTKAECERDIEPAGVTLTIDISSVFSSASIHKEGKDIELGGTEVDLIDLK